MLILLLPSTPQWVHSLGKLTALYRIVIWLNCQLMHNDFRFYPIALKLWKKKKKITAAIFLDGFLAQK